MLKLPLLLFALLGTCAAQQPQDQNALTDLQTTARVLIVFAPDSGSANFKRQLQLIEHHGFELSERNTVVVPASLIISKSGEDFFPGENLLFASAGEQASARSRFHVKPGDFLVILVSQDGTEQIRSANPVDIHELVASLDSLPRH
jgi:Domain of unknown function (DUF4174)